MAATGAKTVGMTQKVYLVDMVEHRHHCLLDNLVLYSSDAYSNLHKSWAL